MIVRKSAQDLEKMRRSGLLVWKVLAELAGMVREGITTLDLENAADRMKVERMVGLVQDALFRAEPELGIRYSTYFTVAAQPTNPHEGNKEVVEFRIIPSEFLHIEVLEKLEKYSY